MSYKRCPDCNAYLDPNESCDCKEKEDASAGTETSSNKGIALIKNNTIIPSPSQKVNETEVNANDNS